MALRFNYRRGDLLDVVSYDLDISFKYLLTVVIERADAVLAATALFEYSWYSSGLSEQIYDRLQ